MAKVELVVEIFGATGSPGGESMPFYASKKAPGGDWLLSEKSTPTNPIQKTLRNGVKLVMLDLDKVPTTQEKAAGTPLWDCVDGKDFFNDNGYCQVWLYQEEPLPSGTHGVPVVPGSQAWGDKARFRPVSPNPQPQPEPTPGPAKPSYEEVGRAYETLIQFREMTKRDS